MHPLFLIIFDCFQQSVFSVHCLMKWVLDPSLSPRILSPVSPWTKLVLMKTLRSYFHEQMPPLPLVLACFAKSDCSKVTSISSLVSLCSGVNCKKSPVASKVECCARTEELLIFIFMVDALLLKFVFRCFRTVWMICNSFKQTCDLWQL